MFYSVGYIIQCGTDLCVEASAKSEATSESAVCIAAKKMLDGEVRKKAEAIVSHMRDKVPKDQESEENFLKMMNQSSRKAGAINAKVILETKKAVDQELQEFYKVDKTCKDHSAAE